MPDPTQCGLVDAMGDVIECPRQRAMGGSTGAAQQGYIVHGGQGFKLRVIINGTAGLRAESNSPNAQRTGRRRLHGRRRLDPSSRTAAGVLVASVHRDPDNLDEVFSNGDEPRPVHRRDSQARRLDQIPHRQAAHLFNAAGATLASARLRQEYNGLGRYSSPTREDIVIAMLNVTLPMPGGAIRTTATPTWPSRPARRVARSRRPSAGQGCWPGRPGTTPPSARTARTGTMTWASSATARTSCTRASSARATRTAGRRPAARTTSAFGDTSASTPPSAPRSWAPSAPWARLIDRVVASDPDDLDLAYGAGDTLTVVFGIATDRSEDTQPGVHSGDRLFVDSLFAFNAQLGQDYSGEWLDDSQFVVTILDAGCGRRRSSTRRPRMAASNCTASVRANVVAATSRVPPSQRHLPRAQRQRQPRCAAQADQPRRGPRPRRRDRLVG